MTHGAHEQAWRDAAVPEETLVPFEWDLFGHETTRLAAVLAATPDFDPVRALDDEREAHRMLYSNLDSEQRRVYRMLVIAGVLDA